MGETINNMEYFLLLQTDLLKNSGAKYALYLHRRGLRCNRSFWRSSRTTVKAHQINNQITSTTDSSLV
jgi:hypothetical protein